MIRVCFLVLFLGCSVHVTCAQHAPAEVHAQAQPTTETLAGRKVEAKTGPARVSFSASVDGLRSYWSVMSFTSLPKETLSIRISDGPEGGQYDANFDGQTLDSLAHNYWRLKAPEKHGFYSLKITEQNSKEQMLLNIIVLHPWNGKDSSVNGYKIGVYQRALYKGYKTYAKPRGFIEVTRENQDNWVSPHFKLKQFGCRQTKTGSIHPEQNPVNTFPKYMLLESRLLIKLELLIQRFKEKGIKVEDGMYVHSAYRTPYYNRMIGNKTVYSRHCYGDAADVFIDVDKDKMMDDLDEDGKTGDDDADIMFQTAHEVLTKPWHEPLVGGVGYYKNQSYRGPFIHVDTRGYEVHWGKDKPKVPSIAGLEELTRKLSKNQMVIEESKSFYSSARKNELKAEREAAQLMALIAEKKADKEKSAESMYKTPNVAAIEVLNLESLPLLVSTDEPLRLPVVAVVDLPDETGNSQEQTPSLAPTIAKPIKSSWWGRVKQFFGRLF